MYFIVEKKDVRDNNTHIFENKRSLINYLMHENFYTQSVKSRLDNWLSCINTNSSLDFPAFTIYAKKK